MSNDIPAAFLERLPLILQPDDESRMNDFMAGRPLSIRIVDPNLGTDEVQVELEAAGLSASSVDWMPSALAVRPADRRRLQDLPLARDGRLFIQSLSSMAAVVALDVQPGLDVLDCCAAPGGKTALVRMKQDGQGILVANDLSRNRIRKMERVLERLGVTGVDLHQQAAETLGGSHEACFDRVLLDAPCSGEGLFQVSLPSTWADWETGKIRRLARLQKRLLRSALQTLRPGGVLVYSTCTLAPEENELVLADVLGRPPVPVVVEPIDLPCAGRRPGITSWDGTMLPEWTRHVIRIVPEGDMSPFFLARLRRTA